MLAKQKIEVSEMSRASAKCRGEPAEEPSAWKNFLHREEMGCLKLLSLIYLSGGCIIVTTLIKAYKPMKGKR